jgi:hypothetical protein
METRRLMYWYWVIAGGLVGFGFIGILSIGLPFLLVGLGLLIAGVVWWHGRGFWLAVFAFGAVPALILAFDILTAPPPARACPLRSNREKAMYVAAAMMDIMCWRLSFWAVRC